MGRASRRGGYYLDPAWIRGYRSPWRAWVMRKLFEASIPNMDLYCKLKMFIQRKKIHGKG